MGAILHQLRVLEPDLGRMEHHKRPGDGTTDEREEKVRSGHHKPAFPTAGTIFLKNPAQGVKISKPREKDSRERA